MACQVGQTLITAFFCSVIALTAAFRGPSESIRDNVGGCRSRFAAEEAEACGGDPGLVLGRRACVVHGPLCSMSLGPPLARPSLTHLELILSPPVLPQLGALALDSPYVVCRPTLIHSELETSLIFPLVLSIHVRQRQSSG